mgnify:CR=1 FL=1
MAIQILPARLANQIAAGEVIQRPASVVKELVENSIDAKSTKITIEVNQGGRSLIRISDNGSGMAHDDALLAIERYATSKIYTDDDLTDGISVIPSFATIAVFLSEDHLHEVLPTKRDRFFVYGKVRRQIRNDAAAWRYVNAR